MYTSSINKSQTQWNRPILPQSSDHGTVASLLPKPKDQASFSNQSLDLLNKMQGEPKATNSNWADLSAATQEMLIKSLEEAKKNNPESAEWVDSILYAVDGETKAAEVPEYWNSENTSQRIVDFAMSFQSVSGEDYESYLEQAKEAVLKGFKLAKDDLGDLPGPSAKLFNDTYESVMKKFDQLLEDYRKQNPSEQPKAEPAVAPAMPTPPQAMSLNLVA
jgi:hypothetical protein